MESGDAEPFMGSSQLCAMFRGLRLLRSCHDVLGISPHASKQELKHRYHELARSLHPDAAGHDSRSTTTFTELQEAYEACLRQAREGESPSSQAAWGQAAWGRIWSRPTRTIFAFQGRRKAPNVGNFQGQPWKWRIRGPLTLSAQRKGPFGLRR